MSEVHGESSDRKLSRERLSKMITFPANNDKWLADALCGLRELAFYRDSNFVSNDYNNASRKSELLECVELLETILEMLDDNEHGMSRLRSFQRTVRALLARLQESKTL